MSPVDDILSQVPISQLAGRLGVDEATAEHAARQVLPTLLGGIQANAAHPAGAASFASALEQHDGGLVDGGVDLDQVDTTDGDKIVSNVFGAQRPAVTDQLGAVGGTGGDLIARLLPILAPIVMSYLARRLSGGSAQGGGGLADVLGSILGSGQPGGGAGALPGGLGDLLGGLLGGGRR